MADTVKHVDSGAVIDRTVPRKGLARAQTPQALSLSPILDAHERAAAEGEHLHTDDSLYMIASILALDRKRVSVQAGTNKRRGL